MRVYLKEKETAGVLNVSDENRSIIVDDVYREDNTGSYLITPAQCTASSGEGKLWCTCHRIRANIIEVGFQKEPVECCCYSNNNQEHCCIWECLMRSMINMKTNAETFGLRVTMKAGGELAISQRVVYRSRRG